MHIFGTPFCYVSVTGSLAHQYGSSARHHTAESLKLWNPSIKSAGTTTAMWPRLSWWNIGIARYFAVLQWEQCQTPPRRASNCETLQLDGRNLIDKIYSPSGAVPSLRVEDNGKRLCKNTRRTSSKRWQLLNLCLLSVLFLFAMLSSRNIHYGAKPCS